MVTVRRLVSRVRHTQLLASLSLLILLTPFFASGFLRFVADVLLLVTFLSAVFAFADRRLHVAIGLLLTVAVQGVGWYRSVNEIDTVSVTYTVLALCFFGYFSVLVLRDVFRARDVSLDTIAGALSVYLLLGIWWAFAYALLEIAIPGSIVGLRGGASTGYQDYMGYSYITLTTLGYGNMVPGNAKADMLASAEAIVGQLYLTVLVARLVAMSLSGGLAAESEEEAGD